MVRYVTTMRHCGRVCASSLFTRLFYVFATIAIVASSEYGVPIEIKYWDTGRSPLSHMVDVTNEFGLKVLAEHNFLNDNNIAFSPYGLMGIMVALYEGVDGDSSYQIQRAMQLPWNRNVMRIGFRDIHRSLKTYFVPEEGFLAGLALNNENVTFNENYKKVLRFYGFDLESEQPPDSNNTSSVSVTTASTTPEHKTSTTIITTLSIDDMTTSLKEEASTTPANVVKQESGVLADSTNGTTTSLNNVTEPTSDSNITTPSTINLQTTDGTINPSTAFVTSSTQKTIDITSSTDGTTFNNEVELITDKMTIVTDVTDQSPIDTSSLTSTQTTDTSVLTTENTVDPEQITTMPTSENITGTTESIANDNVSTTEITTAASENLMPSTEIISTSETTTNNIESVSEASLAIVNESSLETLERKKKSIVDFIFTNPPYFDDYLLYRSFDIGPDLGNTGYGGDEMFLANGLKNIQVTYMNYDTVLEHAYLPHLEAAALRLPLDSDRYYLLVVLPDHRRAGELGRLLARMARESDLSDIYAALRPRHVHAIVPSFIVKGHVTLTTDLQKLGIRDVFEPRQQDFTPMTYQPGVYVRSIEQAVSVAIRKYQPDDAKKNRYVMNRHRVYFSATYPFLYFVMDANIHVALMAGKMVDPLNTRIL
ncbi:unnamed protein product [Parnassius apollo]|uniref:(apollo) hypothetical protein n=1 Tax=Parnassius apollo TaxID=110799 RepID=A0A8S3WJH2_PARAO|nr:unnamed protein product [Parnassius apollo]